METTSVASWKMVTLDCGDPGPSARFWGQALQFHLDLAVEDLDAARAACLGLGGTLPEDQPDEGRWIVMLDPSGHPFCLTRAESWS